MVTETPGRNVKRKTSEGREENQQNMRHLAPSLSRPPHQNNLTTSSPNNSVRLPLATISHKPRKKRKKKKKTVRHSESKRRRGKTREHRRQKHKERRGKHRRTRLKVSRQQQQQNGGRRKAQDRRPPSPSTRRHLQKGGQRSNASKNSINSIAFVSKLQQQQRLENVPGNPKHLQKEPRRHNNITAIVRIPHGDLGIIRPQKTTKSKLGVAQHKTGAPRVYIVESVPPRHRLHHTRYFKDHTSSANTPRVSTKDAEKQIVEGMATRYLKTRNNDDDGERQHLGSLTRFQDKSEKLHWSRKWKDNDATTEDVRRHEWQVPSSHHPPVAEKYAEWGIGPLRPS